VVLLWITSDGISLVIHVWDASDQMPVLKDMTALDDEGGRGLMLVRTLSKDWGAYRKADGKVVWCLITAEPSPGPRLRCPPVSQARAGPSFPVIPLAPCSGAAGKKGHRHEQRPGDLDRCAGAARDLTAGTG
jgi:hypothetical protein